MADPVGRAHWWAPTRAEWLLLFAGWSALGVLQALVGTVPGRGAAGAVGPLVSLHLPLAWFWAVATPAIGAWSSLLRARLSSGVIRVACHLPAVLLAAVAVTALRRALITAAGATLTVPYPVTFLYFADLTIAAYIMAVWAATALEARRRLLERERRTNALESRVAAARLDYLEMQLRPHFLFNALGAVAELGHEAPQAASRMLGNIRALLQNATRVNERGAVPLSSELADLAPYLAIQRIRFADWLELVEDIDPLSRTAMVPRLILQPLVENAVHHGLARRERSGRITISARVAGDRLHVRVTDSGEGLRGGGAYRESRGLGLRNVRERLAALYGSSARIVLTEEPGGGTAAQMDLPLRRAADLPPGADDGADGEREESDARPALTGALVEYGRRHPWLVLVGAWAAVGILRFQHSVVYLRFRDRLSAETVIAAARADAAVVAIWLVLSPLVLWGARRFSVRGRAAVPHLLLHTLVAFAVALGHTALARAVSGPDQPALSSSGYAQLYAWNVAVYATLVALVHVRQIERWITERDLAASRLRLALQDARFQKVMLDLRPSVLIETLRYVEDMTGRDPVRAEQILADLGDFLRLTLDAIYEPTLAVRQECDRLRAYAKVLRVAVSPELQLTLAVPVSAMDEPIPNGVLRAALDAMIAEARSGGASVRVHLESLGGEMLVTLTNASNPSPGVAPARAERGDPRLMEYVREGAVRLISDQPDALRLATSVRPA